MHAHTPFMHDLDIACKNVLISHYFMMHAYACCACNLISVCTFLLILANESHYSDDVPHLVSLMHHYNTPRTIMRNPDHCSISYLFTPTHTNLLPVRIMGYCNKRCQRVIMDTQNVLTLGPNIYMTMGLHACQYCTYMHPQWYSKCF